MREPTQLLEINSTPPGALAELSDGSDCVTPCKLEVLRKDNIEVRLSLQGYQDMIAIVESRTDVAGVAAGAGNAVIGTYALGLAAVYALGEEIFASGSGAGAWIVAGAVCVYLVVATARDSKKGLHRSLTPNPLQVRLKPS